jgi:predicted transcriptional regulator
MDPKLLIIVVLLGVVGYLYFWNRKLVGELGKYASKDANKRRILEALGDGDGMSNEELRELLGVSARTVVNYMDELESVGQVEQVGRTGTNVTYRLKS